MRPSQRGQTVRPGQGKKSPERYRRLTLLENPVPGLMGGVLIEWRGFVADQNQMPCINGTVMLIQKERI